MSNTPPLNPPPAPNPVPPWAEPWLGGTSGRGVRVAVIDSGYRHEGPAPPWLDAGHGLVDPGDELRLSWNDDIADRIGHGTACSQIIHRQAPGAQIVPLRVFGQRLETSPETILAALTWAIENRCQVINLSLGTRSPGALRPFYRLSKRAHDLGQIIVSALPRGGDFSYPAAFEPVLGVTVGDVHGPFDFHYFEDDAAEVHAYGRHRTSWQGTSQTQQGSSFAAPHLSGIVARLLEKEPGLDLAGVRRCLAEMAAARQRGSRQGADRT